MAERQGSEILIIQTAFVGDLLLGIPMFKELRRIYPGAKLNLFCRKGLGGFLLQAGLVDVVTEVDKSTPESWKAGEDAVLAKSYDLLLCPHESFRSFRLAARVKARVKIGYKRFFNLLAFRHRLDRPMELPEALRQLALLIPLRPELKELLETFAARQSARGGQAESGKLVEVPEAADMTVPKLQQLSASFRASGDLTAASSDRVRQLVDKLELTGKRVVFLSPGSVWKTKQWTPDGFTRVAREYLAEGCRVILMGAPNERQICEEIAFRAPGAHVIAGETSLYESAELMALGDLLVCNDSGPMHMGAAAGIPTIAVFGPTVLELGYRPWQNRAAVVQESLPCRPCGKHGSQECPIGTHACMKKIRPEAVLSAAREISGGQ